MLSFLHTSFTSVFQNARQVVFRGIMGKRVIKKQSVFRIPLCCFQTVSIRALIHFDLFPSINRLALFYTSIVLQEWAFYWRKMMSPRPPLCSMQIFINLQPQYKLLAASSVDGNWIWYCIILVRLFTIGCLFSVSLHNWRDPIK